MWVDRVIPLCVCLAVAVMQSGCAGSQAKSPGEELKEYATNAGGEWISEIGSLQFDNKGKFDPAKLRKLSQAALSEIKVLILTRLGIEVAPDVSFLPSLKRLSLALNKLSDIGAVSGLHLKNIDLSSNPLSDVNSLATCTQLELIGLSGTGIMKLPDLAGLTKLKYIGLTKTPLQSLVNIDKIQNDFDLNLFGCDDLVDIDALSSSHINTLTLDEDNFHRLRPWFDVHMNEIKKKRPQFKVQFQLLSGE